MSRERFQTSNGFAALRCAGLTASLLLLAAVALRSFMMYSSLQSLPVTADESITVLQAKRICEGELPLLVLAQPYQFPVEAYLSAPLVRLVPRNTFGGRYLSFLEGFAALGLLILLARRMGGFEKNWPAMLLVMFPSAYLLLIQFGYSLPHNSPFYLAAFGAALLAVGRAFRFRPGCCMRFIAAGLLCGLAFSNNMVALAFIIPILLVSALGGEWRHITPKAALLGIGFCIGLIPYFAAIRLFPGAHAAVAGSRPVGEIMANFWEPGVVVTLTRAMGITPTVYPDSAYNLDFAAWLFPLMPYITAAIVLAATALRAIAVIRGILDGLAPRLGLQDAFIGVVWLNLIIFAASERGYSGSYRYLAPAVWSFPFVVGTLYIGAGKYMRRVIGTACVAMAVLNATTALKLTEEWKSPDFAERVMDAPDLENALDYLRERGISHCVASHWQAYRMNYLSDESILCAQPMNERFPGWPIPYKDRVDASTNVAYVFSARSSAYFNPENFERHLDIMSIGARKAVRGAYSIYSGFFQKNAPPEEQENPVPGKSVSVSSSHNSRESENLVIPSSGRWSSKTPQEKGMWIQAEMRRARKLTRLVLDYGAYYADAAPKINIETGFKGKWRTVAAGESGDIDPFEFERGKPVYGRYVRTFRGGPVLADAVRVTIEEPNPGKWWSLMGIRLFEEKPSEL